VWFWFCRNVKLWLFRRCKFAFYGKTKKKIIKPTGIKGLCELVKANGAAIGRDKDHTKEKKSRELWMSNHVIRAHSALRSPQCENKTTAIRSDDHWSVGWERVESFVQTCKNNGILSLDERKKGEAKWHFISVKMNNEFG
jgi:hypothetical protein